MMNAPTLGSMVAWQQSPGSSAQLFPPAIDFIWFGPSFVRLTDDQNGEGGTSTVTFAAAASCESTFVEAKVNGLVPPRHGHVGSKPDISHAAKSAAGHSGIS